jgi:hypothetical protein
MFAAGAAVGSAVTWKILKTKYDQIIQEEIDSVKEVFAERMCVPQEQEEEESADDDVDPGQIKWEDLEDLDEDEEEPVEDDMNDYQRLVNTYTEEKGGAENLCNEPYVIPPYEYGELDDYEQVELTYYMDNILEDQEYHIVTDADELIGRKALTTFGEYEDDAVFVRNDMLRTDYQILKDYRTYDEARSVGRPDQVDDE